MNYFWWIPAQMNMVIAAFHCWILISALVFTTNGDDDL